NVDSYVLATDASIVEAVNYLSSIGINVIFPVVYNKGYTLYPSSIMDSLFNAPTIPDPSFQNRDFLERLVIEAHRVGIEVIPWFEFGFSSSYSLNGGHIIARFPHWALKNNQGQLVVKNGFDWLSGINPEVQDYMLSLVMEVIDKYDIDGVQGDDRLPAMPVEGGYDSVTVEIYKSEHSGANPPNNPGDFNWKRWRADKLNQFFIRMRDSVKSRSEHLILSSSPTPYPWGYDEYLQDSRYWAQNNIVDNIIPQLYRYDFSGYQSVLSQSLSLIRSVNPDIYFAGVLIKSGSWIITPTLISQIINLNRTNDVNGECTFFYEGLRANGNEIGNFLKGNFYTEPALVPYRNGNLWRPKATIKNEDETGVTITGGSWTNYPMQGFTGQIIRTNQTSSYASVEYKVEVPFSAYFDVYGYLTPNTTWTQQARYVIYSDNDSTEVIINQSELNKKGWQKIGTVYLSQGEREVLKIDNTYLESGRYLVADAMMIMINRKLSPDVVITKVEGERGDKINQPTGYVLEQNYPNPFNPSTKIRFVIPNAVRSLKDFSSQTPRNDNTLVTIKVYDILGNEVATLVNEEKPAGIYEVEFNASVLPSGVYFYKLTVSNFSETKKMILLR
ncbi:MAG: family 10 glycosylhydrolase, partial [Ignavibacterium sp.]